MFTIVALVGVGLILTFFLLEGKKYIFSSYENAAFGFRIHYPSHWTLEENKNGAAVIFYSPLDHDLDYFKDNVTVVVQDNPKDLTLSEYTDLAIKQMQVVFTENFVILESGPATLNGRPAHKLVFLGKGPDIELKYLIVWALDGSKAYQISYLSLSSAYEQHLRKVEKMIGSFRIK